MVVWCEEIQAPSERAMVPENVQFQLRRRRAGGSMAMGYDRPLNPGGPRR